MRCLQSGVHSPQWQVQKGGHGEKGESESWSERGSMGQRDAPPGSERHGVEDKAEMGTGTDAGEVGARDRNPRTKWRRSRDTEHLLRKACGLGGEEGLREGEADRGHGGFSSFQGSTPHPQTNPRRGGNGRKQGHHALQCCAAHWASGSPPSVSASCPLSSSPTPHLPVRRAGPGGEGAGPEALADRVAGLMGPVWPGLETRVGMVCSEAPLSPRGDRTATAGSPDTVPCSFHSNCVGVRREKKSKPEAGGRDEGRKKSTHSEHQFRVARRL